MAALTTLVNTLFTRIGDPSKSGTAGLLEAQSVFLAAVNVMSTPLTYPLSDDPTTGSIWASGERDYVNSSIDQLNSLVQKLQRSNLMA